MAEKIGTPDPDILTGGSDGDVITGLEGGDTLSGGAGDDIISGGPGDDSLEGGDGIDVLTGGDGFDSIAGDGGYDLIAGGAGNDTIEGGEGIDTIALTGRFADYLLEEVVAPSETDPGLYRISDLRTDAPEGRDTFTGIENLRFEIGGEITLADALNRAPTAIDLLRAPLAGPEVLETARAGSLVAQLAAVDRDPGDSFTYTFAKTAGVAENGGGRFAIDGDKLVVAEGGGLDFEVQSSYTVTVIATDRSGNSVSRAITIAVRDDSEVFTALIVELPADAESVKLWELDSGGYIVTWIGEAGGQRGHFARHVTESGATFIPDDHPEGTPPPADRRLMPASIENTAVRLLGVDDEGVAAFVTEINSIASRRDERVWIDALSGDEIRSQTVQPSSEEEFSYDFDDGFVILTEVVNQSGEVRVPSTGYGGGTDLELRWHQGTAVTKSVLPNGIGFDIGNGASWSSETSIEDISHSDNVSQPDITESGTTGYVRAIYDSHDSYDGLFDIPAVVKQHADLIVAGRTIASPVQSNEDLNDFAILDEDSFAVASFGRTLKSGPQDRVAAYFSDAGRTTSAAFKVEPGHTVFDPTIKALGTDRYLLSFADRASATVTVRAQVFDASGNPVTELLSFPQGTEFTLRDNGTVVAYRTVTTPAGVRFLDGLQSLNEAVLVIPHGGAFIDKDRDGDLDYSGTVTIGHRTGVQELLRLEGGTYELTSQVLKVKNATVYAELGKDTVSPLFKGSFDIDRNTGVAANFVVGTLSAGDQALKLGGLEVLYKGLNIRKDAAAFAATFALPDGLFGSPAKLELTQANALVINALGPVIDGFEVALPPFQFGGTLGDPAGIISFNLIEAKGKNLKIKYDASIDEWGITGELDVRSDIVDGLAVIGGVNDVSMKFTDFKIKDGKYDFAGELSAKSWTIGKFTLKDIKIGIKIDDNVLQSVDLAAGFGLPFKALNGLSFAGQALFPPMTLNKIAVTAETTIPLPNGFFIDSIFASVTNMAGSPPEPVSLPTTLTGGIGIGWGPKVPTIELPEFLAIEPIKEARLVNAKFSLSSDFTTAVTATGTINLYKDEIAKHTGAITWDWQRDTLTLAGEMDYLSGLLKGTAVLKASALGLTVTGTVGITVPAAPVFSFLAGTTLTSANIFAQYLDDADTKNDHISAWGTITVPVLGTVTAGLKFDFHTFLVTPILGANDLPKTNSFDVGGTEDWLMISAAWDNAAAGTVATRVRTPEGTFIQEADYAANGITVINQFTGTHTKTIAIDNPRAGNWDLQVIDPAPLGLVVYKGYSPNPPVGIAVSAGSLTAGALTGTASAALTGTDPGTRITFWADTDDAGLDGFALGGTTIDADGTASITFDATLLSKGAYFIYAVADDGHGAPAFDYSATTITVAHRATDIAVTARFGPQTAAGQALIDEAALPGTTIASVSAVSPDRLETFTYTLLDDAGGRFALQGDLLVVGTGAPLDADGADSHTLAIRATSAAGLRFDDTIVIEVGQADDPRFVHQGIAGEREVRAGMPVTDVFFAMQGGDTVSGGTGEDTLYLDGTRAEFSVTVDPTGATIGPVYRFVLPADALDQPNHGPGDPQPPYLVIRDLRTPGASPIVASGIEVLQFRDQRIAAPANGNSAPVARADDYAVNEDAVLAVPVARGILANDSDADGNPLSLLLSAGPAHGALTLAPDGSFTYRPAANFSGGDSFAYRISDGFSQSDPVAVSLTVNPLNDAPTAPAANSVASMPGTASQPVGIGAADADGDPLVFSVKTGAQAAKGSVSFADGSFTYTANANAAGSDSFTILVADGKGGTAEQVVTVTIDADNSPPSAPATNSVTTNEDTVSIPVSIGATDAAGDPLAFSIQSGAQPAKGSVSFADGKFVYTPNANANGNDSFGIVIADGKGGSAQQTVNVTINAVNDAPTAPASRTVTTDQNAASAPVAIGAADVDGDPLAYAVKPGFRPAKGSVGFSGGSFTYTPNANETGSDSFAIVIADGKGGNAEQAVNVTINPVVTEPVNSPPVTGPAIVATTLEDQALTLSIGATDPDGDVLSYAIQTAPAHGRIERSGGDLLVYRPDANFHGTDSFTVEVSDGNSTALQEFAITVDSVNDRPTIAPQVQRLAAQADMPRLVKSLALDVDGDPLTFTAGPAAHGTVTGAGVRGAFIYAPERGFTGTDTFLVTVSDGRGGTATQTIEIAVAPAASGRDFLLAAGNGFAGTISGTGQVMGGAGLQDIAVRDAPGTITFDASFNRGGDIVRLPHRASDYLIMLRGSQAVISDGDSTVILPAGEAGTPIRFADGVRTLVLDGASVRIGGQAISAEARLISAPSETASLPTGADPEARAWLFLGDDSVVSAGGDLAVFGTTGHQTFSFLHGDASFDASFNRGGDTLILSGQAEAYGAVRAGSKIELESASESLVVPVGTAGLTVAFADGKSTLQFDLAGDRLLLGAQVIGWTPTNLASLG